MFRDEYRAAFTQVNASDETHERIIKMMEKENRRSVPLAGKVLLAAVLISGLAITVSAAESVRNWFVDLFAAHSQEGLSQSQVEFLNDRTQTQESQGAREDTMVRLDSYLTDGQVAYVTLKITLPEHLESPGEGWTLEQTAFTDGWFCPADQEKATIEQMISYSFTSRVMDDGDGKDNTFAIVYSLTTNDSSVVFSPGSAWKLHLGGLEAIWRNLENERYLFDEKYAGQDVMLDGEEAAMTVRWEPISEEVFEFILEFKDIQQQELELVKQPLIFTGTRAATMEELMKEPQSPDVGPVEAQLVSFKLSSLTYYIEYAAEDAQISGSFNPGSYYLRMKDGKEIELFPYSGRQNFQEPIVLEEADHVLCPDGSKLPIN